MNDIDIEIARKLKKLDAELDVIRTIETPIISGGGSGAPATASYITAVAEAGLTAERVFTEGPGLDVIDAGANTTLTVGLGGDTILLYDSGGNPIAEFAATDAGLTAAMAAATSGDVVFLPACTIVGDHTITAGVHVVGVARHGTILTGQVTGAASASLENCSITRTANDANALYGVVAQATGTFWLSRVHISISQAGAGNAAAIYSNAGGDVQVWNCSLLAPTGGAGWHYGVYLDAGGNYVEVEGGVCIGFTGATNWSP